MLCGWKTQFALSAWNIDVISVTITFVKLFCCCRRCWVILDLLLLFRSFSPSLLGNYLSLSSLDRGRCHRRLTRARERTTRKMLSVSNPSALLEFLSRSRSRDRNFFGCASRGRRLFVFLSEGLFVTFPPRFLLGVQTKQSNSAAGNGFSQERKSMSPTPTSRIDGQFSVIVFSIALTFLSLFLF